ncbi:FecR family protein [Thalassospira lucentensis]|uniref:FecR family protein n=1 Tax=Thalassospira lucentensis TaxID=168935 RepID=UPI0003B367E1|nr:FecR domain-containing protein [Thalassospira lucentensis]RCK22604.1 hypothetical protein TH1_17110 [Thalassospira lucentensis MCCC 1A00383 = DSM 14000]
MPDHVTTTRSNRYLTRWMKTFAVGSTLALCMSLTAPAKADLNAEMAGVSAAVTGEVILAKSAGEIGTLVESGMPVYLGDRITTSPNAGMQILLLDETVFTIGPNSDIAIDEFVYDPVTGDGRIVADMARGVMRFVTGKIPLNNPASMDINLPVGSIGIRGTIGLIRSVSAEQANQIMPGTFDTSSPDGANQQIFMAVNQGPGLSRNDTTSRPGAFAVSDQTGNSENITGENFGVFVSNSVVTEPARFPIVVATYDFSANLVRTASRRTTSDSAGTSSIATGNQQPSLTSGQFRQADTQTGSTMAGTLDVAMAQASSTSSASNQIEVASILNNAENTDATSTADSAYTLDAMSQVSLSSPTITGSTTAANGSLSYNFNASVNFASRALNIQFTSIKDSGADLTNAVGSAEILGFDFTSRSGAAAFSGTDFNYGGGCTTNASAAGCSASATFKDLNNIDFELTTNAEPTGASGSTPLN